MTRPPAIVLVHGWGYDAGLWGGVRTALDPGLRVETLDLGFFGAVSPAPTFDVPVIAVGHSLGVLWWLTQATPPWKRLLSINGFPRFTAASNYAPAVSPRVLARMKQQLLRDPAAVLADFHSRCSTSGLWGPSGTPNAARLATGLDWLTAWDGRTVLAARRSDVFALAGSDDPIVPAAMSAMAFSGQCEQVAAPGHLLPVTHPELCARRITELMA